MLVAGIKRTAWPSLGLLGCHSIPAGSEVCVCDRETAACRAQSGIDQPLRCSRVQPADLVSGWTLGTRFFGGFLHFGHQQSGGAWRRYPWIRLRHQERSLTVLRLMWWEGYLPSSVKCIVAKWVIYRLLVRLVVPQKWFYLCTGHIQRNSGVCCPLHCRVSTALHSQRRRKCYKCSVFSFKPVIKAPSLFPFGLQILKFK